MATKGEGSEPRNRVPESVSDALDMIFAEDAESRSNATTFVRAGLLAVGALMAGVGQFLKDPLPATPPAIAWNLVIGYVGVALVFAGGIWTIFAERSAPKALQVARLALREADRKEGKIIELQRTTDRLIEDTDLRAKILEEHNDWLSGLYTFSQTLREVVERQLSAHTPLNEQGLQEILDSNGRRLTQLLDFDASELWTIAIFRANGEKPRDAERLVCVANLRADRTEQAGEHRTWGRGEGVAGHAFMTARELIVHDLQDTERYSWLHVPDEKKSDKDRYRSLAAVPISVGSQQDPWGVVVATSDVESRFDLDGYEVGAGRLEPLRLLAGIVAVAVAASNSQNGASPA
jgi:hypothetical protein